MSVAALFAIAKSGASVEALLQHAKGARTGAEASAEAEAALLKAARNCNAAAAREAICASDACDLNVRCGFSGMTALHWSAEKGCIAVARVLLDAGATVDSRDSSNWTPLMAAVQKNNVDMVRLLLGFGADPNARVRGKAMIIELAAGEPELMKLLEQAASGSSSSGSGKGPHEAREGPPSSRTRSNVREGADAGGTKGLPRKKRRT